jgi:serine phosphatase RsbU (regulator of sigma subunit)
MLPDELALSSVLGDSFVLLLPKDIVSGDFYWFSEFNENGESKIILAAVDCTGHGVPGAFMSMAGHAYLNQIVNVQKIVSPDLILHELHKNLFRSLKKGETHNKDGMDLAICVLDRNKKTVEFAGAKNPLLFVQNGELTVIKGDRDSIGGDEEKVTFNKHVFEWSPDMVFYMISDGYEDQFGGPLGKKIMRRAFYELLRRVSDLPMDLQKEKLLSHFNDWKLNTTQIDDVLVIGFRINALVK